MSSFSSVPYADIVSFLTINNQPIPGDKNQAYLNVWSLILDNPWINTPSASIADFIIAYNLSAQGIQSPQYNTSSILLAHDKILIDLANILGLQTVDKERIIRILGYLGVLNNDMSVYDMLPDDILKLLAEELDCKSIVAFCNMSERFERFCSNGMMERILREKLQTKTRLDITKYDKKQLGLLCLMPDHKNIACGDNYSLLLNNEGQVFSFGMNFSGQLGLEDTSGNISTPTLILGLNNIAQMSGGYAHSLVLNNQGQVYSFGLNSNGELGLGDDINRYIPTLIQGLNNIIQTAAGGDISFLLNAQGQVYSCGFNHSGQLGLGDTNNRYIPTLIPGLSDIIQIASGDQHVLLLNNQGQVYSFGLNEFGELGLGDTNDRNVPTLIQGVNNITQISAGNKSSLLLNNVGHVYSMGHNDYGQLGLGDVNDRNIPTLIPEMRNIIQINTESHHTLLLNDVGQVYSCGHNINGELGLGDNINKYTHTLVPGLSGVVQVASGDGYSLVLDNQGQVYSFGFNNEGQLGLGDTNNRNVPTLLPDVIL